MGQICSMTTRRTSEIDCGDFRALDRQILRDEPEARDFAIAIAEADHRRISAASYLEAAIVIDGSSRIRSRAATFDDLGARGRDRHRGMVTAEQAKVAREAYRDFGRGSRHASPGFLELWRLFAYATFQPRPQASLFFSRATIFFARAFVGRKESIS